MKETEIILDTEEEARHIMTTLYNTLEIGLKNGYFVIKDKEVVIKKDTQIVQKDNIISVYNK